MSFKKFPHIEQFKSVIKQVRDYAKWNNVPVPTHVKFTGTVKLHGTNSAVGLNVQTGEKFYQSRERIIDIQSDNYGFAMWASGSNEISQLLNQIRERYYAKEFIHVFGEWCCGNIQKGVALSQLPTKRFVVFAISVDDQWVDLPSGPIFDVDDRIFFINQFPQYEIVVDFTQPELIQNTIVDMVMKVEEECPVGKMFGVSGIGEGIVFSAFYEHMFLIFKAKGEKHSASKVKTLKEIAPIDVERMASMKQFVSNCLTENRLEQGIQKLGEMGLDSTDNKNIGVYIKWCVDDVFREERDIIVASEFDAKKLGKELSTVARQYFLGRIV